jgi:anti-sigma factor RsiW
MEEALEMDSHSDRSLDILRYLDHQLKGKELEAFLAHLEGCPECKAQLTEEQALSRLLQNSGPLYTASPALQARVAAVLGEADQAPVRLRSQNMMSRSWRSLVQWAPNWRLAVPVALALVVGLIFIPNAVQHVNAASYVSAAATAHRSYLEGSLPLEINSDSPEKVTAWFAGKLPFTFHLPSSQRDLNTPSIYRLIGARLVNYHGSRAALVTYKTVQKQPISLLVTSSKLAPVVGGDEVHDGSLTFHYHTNQGFKVITWTARGLAYALVSDVSGSPRESCLVCHQSMADHDTFKAGS